MTQIKDLTAGSTVVGTTKIPGQTAANATVYHTAAELKTYIEATVSASLTAHLANVSNPHSVTKTQVGLSAVTNDAQLKIASNLADLNNAATARTSLGLGTWATQNTASTVIASTLDISVTGNVSIAATSSFLLSGTSAQIDGNLYNNGYVTDNGMDWLNAQFDKTNTTLASSGLGVNVEAGKTYTFLARLYIAADNTGGHKYAVAGTATATSIVYQVNSINNGSNAYVINSRQTALAGSVGAAGGTLLYTEIAGTITVNAAGTLLVQFAQNAASGTSSLLRGSSFIVTKVSA